MENKGSTYAEYLKRYYGKTINQLRKDTLITIKEHANTRKVKMDINIWRRTTPK